MCSVPSCGPKRALKPIPPPSQTASASPTKVSSPDASMAAGRVCKDARIDGSLRVSVGLEPPPLELGTKGCSLSGRYPVDVAPAAHTAPSQGRRRRPTRSGVLPGPWARSHTSLRPVGPEPHYRHGGPKLAKLLSTAPGTLVPASRGGPESDRFSRRLGPASLATRGGPESDRSLRRLGPESLASRVGPESDRYQQAPRARVPRHRGGPEPARNPVTQPQLRRRTRARARQLPMASGVQATVTHRPSRTAVPATEPQHLGRCPAANDRSGARAPQRPSHPAPPTGLSPAFLQ